MLISTLISGLNQTFWVSVVLGLLFFSFDIPLVRISLLTLGFGPVFLFLVLPFYRQLSYRELLTRFLNAAPNLPPHANRIFTAALDFELHPGADSPELRNRAIRDAEKRLEPLDPFCVVPIQWERISTAVSVLIGVWGLGFGVWGKWGVDSGQWTVDSGEREVAQVEPTPPNSPALTLGADVFPSTPKPQHPTPIAQQVSLFLRTKKEFLSLLGKSQSRLSLEKRQLLDAMSQRQRLIAFNQEGAIKEQMLENADHFAANRLGQSLQLQRDILLALDLDPDRDYEKEDGVTPFSPETFSRVPATESTQYEMITLSENQIGSDPPGNFPQNHDAANPSRNLQAGSEASQGVGTNDSKPSDAPVDIGASEERYLGLWGELPENERQIGQGISRDQVLPEYKTAVDRYYRTLFHAGQ